MKMASKWHKHKQKNNRGKSGAFASPDETLHAKSVLRKDGELLTERETNTQKERDRQRESRGKKKKAVH